MEPETSDGDPWIQKSYLQTACRKLPADDPCRLLRAEAEDPQTTGPRLEALTQLSVQAWQNDPHGQERWAGNLLVLEAVVAHPNAPLPLLLQHGGSHSRAFCSNPIAPLILLEMPDFAHALSASAQFALLQEEAAPLSLVRQLTYPSPDNGEGEAVSEAAQMHIAFAGEVDGDEWQSLVRAYFRNYCARAKKKLRQWHCDFAETHLAPPWASGPPPVPPPFESPHASTLNTWFSFAHLPGSREEAALLQRIAPKMDKMLVAHALRNEAASVELSALLKNPQSQAGLVRWAVLQHPSVTPEIIRLLVKSDNGRFAREAASHPKTPPDLIREFCQAGSPEVRRLARKHPHAPPDACDLSRRAALKEAKSAAGFLDDGAFVSLIECLHRESSQRSDLPQKGDSLVWTQRLEAVLLVPPEINAPLSSDFCDRTGRDLLIHLSRDGNRLVRAAARARLANPAALFVL